MRSDAAAPLHLAASAEAALGRIDPAVARILDRSLCGEEISAADALCLWQTTGPELQALCQTADELRRRAVGDTITYVVNRNINWTNICFTDCSFCAFGVSAGWSWFGATGTPGSARRPAMRWVGDSVRRPARTSQVKALVSSMETLGSPDIMMRSLVTSPWEDSPL